MSMRSTGKQSSSDIILAAKEVLQPEPGLHLAILYGSAAKRRLREDSDVDIAVLFDHPLSAGQKMELISRLERRLQRDVDLVDLFSLNGTILKQVLCSGMVLLQTEPQARAGLTRRMIFNQEDMMPYVSRTLIERQRRFIDG